MDISINTTTRRTPAQAFIGQLIKFLKYRNPDLLGSNTDYLSSTSRFAYDDEEDINNVPANSRVRLGSRFILRKEAVATSDNVVTYTVYHNSVQQYQRTFDVSSSVLPVDVKLKNGSTITAYQTKPWIWDTDADFETLLFKTLDSFWRPIAKG